MLRILVLDDEPYVVDWISMLLEMQIQRELDICRSYSVEEALEFMTRTRVDIVISDICMPGMDGIVFAGQVKDRWPFAKVILITGYTQFDMAVNAIRNNVVSYIVKTQGDDIVVEEVKRVIEMIDRELGQSGARREIDVETLLPGLRNDFFRTVFEQGEDDAEKIAMNLEMLRVSFQADTPVRIILGHINKWENMVNPILRQQSAAKMVELMNSYLGDLGIVYPVPLAGCRMGWIINEQHKKEGVSDYLIQGRLEMLQDAYAAGGGEEVSFILYSRAVCIHEIREAYRSLQILMNRIIQEKNSFVIFGGEEFEQWKIDVAGVSRRMTELLSEKKYQEFKMIMQHYRMLVEQEKINSGDCYSLYYSIALLIHMYMEENLQELSEKFDVGKTLFIPPVDGVWGRKFEELSIIVEKILSAEMEIKDTLLQKTVDTMKNYILDHITEDISLTCLSEVTGYNTCYLSRIFKAQEGINLSEFISDRKMERVRTLMSDTEMGIGEIAEAMGFSSRTYFNRFIRKNTGMSPRDYKASLMK